MIGKTDVLGTTLYECVATGIVLWLDAPKKNHDPDTPRKIREKSLATLAITLSGFYRGKNFGRTRKVSIQDSLFFSTYQLPRKKTVVANTRAWSMTSQEDLNIIAQKMALSPIPFGFLRENIGVTGIPDLSHYPPGTLLIFREPGTEVAVVILSVFSGNKPCHIPAKTIAEKLDFPDAIKKFPVAAMEHRGLVGSVIKGGTLRLDQEVDVWSPVEKVDWF